jgi:mono/diheme cytochrome c family protein
VPLCAWTGLERTGNDQVPCEDAEPETLESQRNCGRAVFARYCVECHATEDEKGPAFQATRLFGYTTVENLVFYTTFSMPQNDPGQLSDQGYWNVMAYVVDSLGMYAGSEVLSERNGSIPLIRP